MQVISLAMIALCALLPEPYSYIYVLMMLWILPASTHAFSYRMILWVGLVFSLKGLMCAYWAVLFCLIIMVLIQLFMLAGKPLKPCISISIAIIGGIMLLCSETDSTLALCYGLYIGLLYHLYPKQSLIWIVPLSMIYHLAGSYALEYLLCFLLAMSILYGKKALVFYLFLPSQTVTVYLVWMLLMMIFHRQRKSSLFTLCVGLFVLPYRLFSAVFVLCGVIVSCVMKESAEQPAERSLQDPTLFQLLHDFYLHRAPQTASLLRALSMIYHQPQTRNVQDLKDILQEYGYHIHDLQVEQSELLHVYLHIQNIRRGELQGMLQPLLSDYFKMPLTLMHTQKEPQGYTMTFAQEPRFTFEWQCESFAYAKENGDTYRIFSCGGSLIALLCDGMGNGEHARECSYLAVSLFHRLTSYGMQMEEAMHCINAMMQSERFTTMDVLRLSMNTPEAALAKSAACPTLLYRDGTIIELCGCALPLGIVSSLEVDLTRLEIQDGDVFFLYSDGFQMEDIKTWIQEHHIASRQGFDKLRTHCMCNVKDDATIIRIAVQENKQATCNL